MPGEAAGLSGLHGRHELFLGFREANDARNSEVEEEYLEWSIEPMDLERQLAAQFGVSTSRKNPLPDEVERAAAVSRWKDTLWSAATELTVRGKVDRLFERYWSLKKGKGRRRPTEEDALNEATALEDEQNWHLDRWVMGERPAGLDGFFQVGEWIEEILREPGEAREIEFRTAQLALVAEYMWCVRRWSARAGGRALQLAMLADDQKLPPPSRWMLTRITNLFIDGHDVAVVALCRSALEAALTRAMPDSVVLADSDDERVEVTLQERINAAFRAKRLSKEERDLAHRIRKRSNEVLHGVRELVPAEESLGILTALVRLLKVLG